MVIFDYNGDGFWSVEAVTKRYHLYSRRFDIKPSADIQPVIITENGTRRIYPIMDKIIKGIETGDAACIEIGIEFIEESASFPFGRILKSNTARALRRASEFLSANQKERIRERVADMLCTEYLPREFRQYAKLARKIGLANQARRIDREANLENVYVRHYYQMIMTV